MFLGCRVACVAAKGVLLTLRSASHAQEPHTHTAPVTQDAQELDTQEGAATCAICLNVSSPEDVALVRDCLHAYCAPCILAWASSHAARYPAGGDTPCPTCKRRFSALYVYRTLDGRVVDYPVQESVVLLLRARWAAPAAALQDDPESEEDYGSDDEEERLAHRHNVRLIGNRRFGGGGFVSSGRLMARPVPPPPPPPRKKQEKAEPAKTDDAKAAAASASNVKRAKREAKAAQAAEKEAARRARRRERLTGGAAADDQAAGACGDADEAGVAVC
jgi:hypothetical protein